MTFEDAIAYSRNVVAAKVALRLGQDHARRPASGCTTTWRSSASGEPTGIDVANEVGGLVRDPASTPWRQIDLANGAFGQGVAVTPIQLAQAYAAMVNGGSLVQPHVVKAVGDRETSPDRARPGDVGEARRRRSSKLMNHVVTEVAFYRDRTLIPGYEVGGKTGTAQIWDERDRRRWKVNLFNYSFVGYIGRETGRPGPRRRGPDRGGHADGRRGVGHLEMPVMSFELFRRIANDAITTPTSSPNEHVRPPLVAADP